MLREFIKLLMIDAIQMIPAMCKLMKSLVSGKISSGSDVMMVSKNCSDVLQNKMPKS